MNCQNSRFLFRLAKPEDAQNLLEIIEEDEFKGKISLLYTRRPDAYQSFMKEGEEVTVVVCQDTINDKIIGFGSCAIRKVYINGNPEKVGYLFGLRLKKEYRKTFSLLAKSYDVLYSFLKDKGIKYFFTTILEDNLYTQNLLEKKRRIMPYYEPFGNYEVYTLKSKRRLPDNSNMGFRQAGEADIPLIAEFLNEQGKNFQFYPVINEYDLTGNNFWGLVYRDFYILSNHADEILAVGAAWDQKSYKQYIVRGYGGILKHVYPISAVLPLMGYPTLPKPGSVLDFCTISFWAVKGNDPGIFEIFIRNIVSKAKDYPFFLIGVHRNNPLRDVLFRMPHIKYSSKVYLVNWEKDNPVADSINPGLATFLECGTL